MDTPETRLQPTAGVGRRIRACLAHPAMRVFIAAALIRLALSVCVLADIDRAFLRGDSHSYDKLGMLLERRGIAARAITEYEAAVGEDADFLDAHRRLAALYRTRDIERAIEHCEKIVSLAPEDAESHYQLGLLYYEQRDVPNAIKALRQSISVNADHQPARTLLEEIEANRPPEDVEISD